MVTFALDTAVERHVYDPDETALTAVIKVRDMVLSVMNSFQEEEGDTE